MSDDHVDGRRFLEREQFGVYVHIPFCASRCDYCAFATWTDREGLIDDYLAAVRTDISRAVGEGMPSATSIFVGGGTPTLVPAEALADLIMSIPTRPLSATNTTPTGDGVVGEGVAGEGVAGEGVAGDGVVGEGVAGEGVGGSTAGDGSAKVDGRGTQRCVEITVECNPDDVTPELIACYEDAGVNRLSIGVQSTQPSVLAELGRAHRGDNIVAAVEAVRGSGIASFNLDLILGARGESLADVEATIADVVAFGPPHVSAYGLTAEPGTPLGNDPQRHPDGDDIADKYAIVDIALGAAGLESYEISNWARPGYECAHNLLYWRQGNYRGFGCAAHSHQDGRRWWNLRTPERYINAVRNGDSTMAAGEQLTDEQRRVERLDLALRTSDGVSVAHVDTEALAALDGLVTVDNDDNADDDDGDNKGRVRLTRAGRLLANEVSLRLISR